MQVSPHEAFVYLLEVLQLGDNNPYVWFLLGECARLRRRYVDAARLLRRARVMLVVSHGDVEALRDVDAAIAILVEEIGGPEKVNALVTDMDAVDPIALLQPENDDEHDDVVAHENSQNGDEK
uniref:CCR4-NOT transcription complex subunit 10-A n=1 Tax=Lygus hesperus TaxID=30085 RepID=A0A0A9WWA1_LYGHE